jgi:hypothetical protein
MMNQKGYVYTVISMMLALVLLAVVSLYYDSYKSAAELSPSKLRTDELHYYVESAKKDTGRAMSVTGRRAAACLVNYTISNHITWTDANNTLAELIANGTINTIPYAPMQGQTLTEYLNKLQNIGNNQGFTTSISLRTINIYPYDSLHFLVVARYNYTITDEQGAETGVCGYENENQTLYAMIPIDGLEDPLYALNTSNKISRTINHSTQSGIQTMAYADQGTGTGGGFVNDISSRAGFQDNDIEDYNALYPELVPYTVFVINTNTGSLEWGEFSTNSKTILSSSGGVIDTKEDGDLADNGFPYLSGINVTLNFTDKDHVIIRNGAEHQIIYLWMNNDIKNRLYANSTNGSSFFDRLEGRGNLSGKYRNQSAAARALLGQNTSRPAGIESYVNLSDLSRAGMDITAYQNYSSVDYLFFQNTSGKWVYGTPYWFRMDAYNYKIKNLTDYCYDDYAAIWHFDEGTDTTTYDGSRNAHAATLSGTASIGGEGKKGASLDLTGGGSGEADAVVDVSEAAYTAGIWFKTLEGATNVGIYSTDNGASNHDRDIWLDSSGNLCTVLQGASSTEQICTPGDPYNDDAWHYAVHVYDSSTAQTLYVDGVAAAVGLQTQSNHTTQTRVRIGYSPNAAYDFVGWIDDVKIWNRALSAEEIREEYQKLL